MRRATTILFLGLLLVPPVHAMAAEGFNLPAGEGITQPDLSALPDSGDEIGADQETGGFNTADIILNGLSAFSDCVEYCITGLSIRMRLGIPIEFYFSPLIRHNTADFLVQSYTRLTEDPWKEWGSVVGEASLQVTSPVAKLLGTDELGGGRTQVAAYNKAQNLDFKEADVIGNPYILLTVLLDKNGRLKPKQNGCETNGCLERGRDRLGSQLRNEIEDRQPPPECIGPRCFNDPTQPEEVPWYEKTPEELMGEARDGVATKIGDYAEKLEQCSQDLRCILENLGGNTFSRVFSMMDTLESVAGAIQGVQEISRITEEIAAAFSALSMSPVRGKFRVERMFCPSEYQPFIPYYLSGLDMTFWRSGLIDVPPVDPHMASTILNPFSSDRIGTATQLWGHIYPRSGFVDNVHDAKVGAVAAVRAMNIVSEMKRTRLRWLPKGFDAKKSQWQMIYPHKSDKCDANIANTGKPNVMGDFMYPGKERRYAWNYWREYDCDTNKRGRRIAKISLPEICF